MRHPASLALTAVLALSSCYPFVTGDRFEERLCELDEDGDGNLKCDHIGPDGETVPGDCNDHDPRMSFLNEEIPYDGIDNNCSGSDILDVDQDGFPGIGREEYEAQDGLAWPTGMSELVDCDDEDPTIYPGAPEIWYDGVDQNCDGLCDFDADQDGFADRRQGQDNDCGIPATDCLDTNPNIYPGAPGEVYYDGEDTNCDGVNDFDPDGDGYAWAGYEAANLVFLDRYGYEDSIVAYTECYDIDDDPLPSGEPIDPASINPTTENIWYNGINDNCSDLAGSLTNDFDQDGDGFMPTAMRADFLAYVRRYVEFKRHADPLDPEAPPIFPYRAKFVEAFGPDQDAWEAYFDSHDNDCNDEDPTIFPGALEVLGDGVDRDCDGNTDSATFVRGNYTMSGFGELRVAANDEHFLMIATFLESTRFGDTTTGPRIAALSWDLDMDPTTRAVVDSTPFAPSSGQTLRAPISLIGIPGGYLTGLTYNTSTQNNAWLVRSGPAPAVSVNYWTTLQNTSTIPAGRPVTVEQIETVLTDDRDFAWMVACGDDRIARITYQVDSTFDTNDNIPAIGIRGCFLTVEDDEPTYYGMFDDGIEAWQLEGGLLEPVGSHAFESFAINFARNHEGHLLLGQSDRVFIRLDNGETFTAFEGESVLHADVTLHAGRVYIGAIVEGDDGPESLLTYGEPGGSLTTISFPFDHDGDPIEPGAIALEAQGDRLLMVVHGIDVDGEERIGWVTLEL